MNILQLRKETPATKNIIHLNNAGASLMPNIVVEGVKTYLDCEAKLGGYETATHFHRELHSFYEYAAELIHAAPEEIAFTESATVAWQRAFHSISFQKGDIILTCVSEYASNYIAYLQLVKQKGIVVKIIPNNVNGEIDIHALEKEVSTKVKLISICHIPTGNGLINPCEAVGNIAKKYNLLYLLDACQSIGQYPVDVNKINCDFLSVTGRKYLRGPRGTGFLYARKETTRHLEPVFLDLHGANWVTTDTYQMRADAKKYETWESNLSNKFGLSLAIQYLNDLGVENVYTSIISLATYFRDALQTIQNIDVRDTGLCQSGIVTFTCKTFSAEQVKNSLSKQGINVSIVVASSSLPDLEERKINEVIRASVHYFNTKEEIDKVINTMRKLMN